MKYADRNSDLDRFGEMDALIEAMLDNRRIKDPERDEYPFVTDSLKYTAEPKKDRETQPYAGDNPRVERQLNIFGFDELTESDESTESDEPMVFQTKGWETLFEQQERKRSSGNSQAALITAPTGIGKTEVFLGAVLDQLIEEQSDTVVMVYPRRSLLEDQLGRILENIEKINEGSIDADLNVGLRYKNIPYRMDEIKNERGLVNQGKYPVFRPTSCWCGDDNGNDNPFYFNSGNGYYNIKCGDCGRQFDNRELILHRNGINRNPPDILLTTLESLELLALKPNRDVIDHIDTIVFDEVHLLNGTYGAHAANIIRNVRDILDDRGLHLIGASATLDGPERFAHKLFGLPTDQIETIQPVPSVDYKDSEEQKHYYFLLSDDAVGVSSTYIQQTMLLGHSMLQETEDRRKILSFIDSTSQVNQRHGQFHNADSINHLWQYHAGDDAAHRGQVDWSDVAREYGNEFIDQPLRTSKGHADDTFDRSDIATSDLLVSTSYMEVGIDVSDIKVVTQYRGPFNLSSFVQRAGRAGREKGMEPHILTFLSQETGDANLYYRAGRFLNSEITTPLNTDNSIIDWIHDRYREFYEIGTEINAMNGSDEELHETFLRRYLDETLGLQEFYRFLDDPSPVFKPILDEHIDDVLDTRQLDRLEGKLRRRRKEITEEVAPLLEFIDVDGDQILLQDDAIDRMFDEIDQGILKVVSDLREAVSDVQFFIEEDERINELEEELDEIEEAIDEERADVTEKQRDRYQKLRLQSDRVRLNAEELALEAEVPADTAADLRPDALDELTSAIDSLTSLLDEDQFREKQAERTQIYYLREVIDELDDYLWPSRPYLSLYATKSLLRAAYYFLRYREVEDDIDEEFYYVPENYFSESGLSFTVQTPTSSPYEEPVSKITTQYAPFVPQYQDDGKRMLVFQPPIRETEDGELVFDFTGEVSGDIKERTRIPRSIKMTSVADLSGEESRQIVSYCPDCYALPQDYDSTCPRGHGACKAGKVYAEPIVNSSIIGSLRKQRQPSAVEEALENLASGALTARVQLDGVKLEITPAYRNGDEFGLNYNGRFTKRIESGQTPLGFSLDTRGIVWEVEHILEEILEEDVTRELIQAYKSLGETGLSVRDIVVHTAAHYLLLVVSDVSGASSSDLLYGHSSGGEDETADVSVFERTEGGQGVTDLLIEALDDAPSKVVEALVRVGYNVQLENQQLWQSKSFRDKLLALDTETIDEDVEAAIREIVVEESEIPFELVIESLTEEVISTVDNLEKLIDEQTRISETQAYTLKGDIVSTQFEGTTDEEEVIESMKEIHGEHVSDFDQVRRLLVSPDVDGCIANLQVPNCTASVDEAEAVSYRALSALRDRLLSIVSEADAPREPSPGEGIPIEYDGVDGTVIVAF